MGKLVADAITILVDALLLGEFLTIFIEGVTFGLLGEFQFGHGRKVSVRCVPHVLLGEVVAFAILILVSAVLLGELVADAIIILVDALLLGPVL